MDTLHLDRVGGDLEGGLGEERVVFLRLRRTPPLIRFTALLTLSHIQRSPYSTTGVWNAWR